MNSLKEMVDNINALFSQQKIQDALAACEQTVAAYPQAWEGYALRGLMRLASQDAAAAKEDFTKALELNPAYDDGYSYLGDCKLQLKDVLGALADYQTALDRQPRNPQFLDQLEALQNQLVKVLPQGLASQEITLPNGCKATVLSDSAGTKVTLYDVNDFKQKFPAGEGSQPQAASAPAQADQTPEQFIQQADQLLSENKIADALACCDKALQQYPQHAALYYRKALLLWQTNENIEAVQEELFRCLKKAEELDPHFAMAHKLGAYVYASLGKTDLALQEYTQTIAADPEDWEGYALRGEFLLMQDKYQDALNDLTKALSLGKEPKEEADKSARSPLSADRAAGILHSLAQCQALSGDEDAAMRTCNQAIEQYAQSLSVLPNLYMLRGNLCGRRQQIVKALENFQKALELSPKDENILNAVGSLQQQIADSLPEGTPAMRVTLKNGYKATIVTTPQGETVTLLHLSPEDPE